MANESAPRVAEFTVEIRIAKLGGGFIGVGNIGNVQFRGNRKTTAYDAAIDIFMQLSQQVNADAMLAVDIAATGDGEALADLMKPRQLEAPVTPAFGYTSLQHGEDGAPERWEWVCDECGRVSPKGLGFDNPEDAARYGAAEHAHTTRTAL